MKELVESLFDDDLIKKDLLLNNTEFKKWINQPNILWYIYYYWESGEDDWLNDFANEQWKEYKPLVDYILKIIDDEMKKVMGPRQYTWYMINFDMYEYETSISDKFEYDEEFYDMMNSANYEILSKSTDENDGITKTWFRGALPKNSNVTELLRRLEVPFAKYPGRIDGGIFLTNEDTIMVMTFPKGTPKNILKLFDIK